MVMNYFHLLKLIYQGQSCFILRNKIKKKTGNPLSWWGKSKQDQKSPLPAESAKDFLIREDHFPEIIFRRT